MGTPASSPAATDRTLEVRPPAPADRPVVPVLPRYATGLALTTSAVTVGLAVPMLADPGLLDGPAVMVGNARGTALVMAAVAVPLLLVAVVGASRRAAWAPLVWLGATAYLAYNAVLLLFATPFNRLFPLYVATLALSIWTAVAIIAATDLPALAARFGPRFPARALAGFVAVIVAGNAALWLRIVAVEVTSTSPGDFLAGTGMTTNPVIAQDLAIWLPLMAVAAWWLARRRPIGFLAAGAGLVFWFVEGVGVAVDQWFGHRADPASPHASLGGVVIFAALAVACAIALVPFARALLGDGRRRPPGPAPGPAPGEPLVPDEDVPVPRDVDVELAARTARVR